MNREEALEAIKENIENANLVKHMLATEAVMRALARRLGEDEEEWGLTGLLHDIDIDLTQADMHIHGKLGADLVGEMGGSHAMAHAILAHNPAHGAERTSLLDKALYCADPLTGLITAAALIMPDKRLDALEAKSVRKRLKEERFAPGADREQIASSSELDIPLDEFIELGLNAMKVISADLGL